MQEHTDDYPPPWERVLWKKQAYADNYIPPDFFRVRTTRRHVSPSKAFIGCTNVTKRICSCLMLLAVFFGLSSSLATPLTVLLATALYAAYCYRRTVPGCSSVLETAVLLVALCGVLCGGVLQSLTASIATDTVYACTALLLVLHVGLYDYGQNVAITNSALSQNVGVFACVCLASRLSASYWHVFSFTVAGIALFAEHDKNMIRPASDELLLAETVFAVLITGTSVWLWATSLLPLFLSLTALANVVAPVLFISLQHHRQNIYGPWDEARIDCR